MFTRINKIARAIGEELERTVIGIRVMANCLLLYFDTGSCRFYSKKELDWGRIGRMYIVPATFRRESISKRMWEQYEGLIKWTEEWIYANFFQRMGLMLEYNMKYV